MYSAFKCLGKVHFSCIGGSSAHTRCSDLTANEYPWVCLKEHCVFILEIDECAECSRTCKKQYLVQNFPDSAARFPESRSDLLPDVSQCIG